MDSLHVDSTACCQLLVIGNCPHPPAQPGLVQKKDQHKHGTENDEWHHSLVVDVVGSCLGAVERDVVYLPSGLGRVSNNSGEDGFS